MYSSLDSIIGLISLSSLSETPESILVRIAITQLNMGNIASDFNHTEEAGEYYRERLKTYESLGNQWGIANCLGNLGNVAFAREEYTESLELHERSLAISTRIGDGEGEVICNMNLARDVMRLGNHTSSSAHYREALTKAASLGLLPLALSALLEIVKILIQDTKLDCAASALLFMQDNIDAIFFENEKSDCMRLLGQVLDELSEEKKNKIRASVESISLPEIAKIVLEIS